MMSTGRSVNKPAAGGIPKAQIDDPAIILFQGLKPALKAGSVQLESFGSISDKIFGRTVEDVKADFEKVSRQINQVLATAFSQAPGGLDLDTVEISLGFTAEGKLAFIAQAGVEATVSVTFKKP
jgi:hypothetical protein